MALASVHNCDKEGQASIAHTDISPGQFIKVNGRYKLNDFNRARFIRYRRSNGTQCTFQVGSNAGKNRSPEEYKYAGETEMVSRLFVVNQMQSCGINTEILVHDVRIAN